MKGLLCAGLLIASAANQGTSYYFSPSGSDANSGTSPSEPFQSFAALANLEIHAGDKILLQSGQMFDGPILLDAIHVQTPLEISIFNGEQQAVLLAGRGPGIVIQDLGDIKISHLNIVGSGPSDNATDGLRIVNQNKNATILDNVQVEDVEISGFGIYGLLLTSTEKGAGFRNVLIDRVVAHDNALGGIEVESFFPDQPHRDISVTHSVAYKNRGKPGFPGPSGNGIVLSGVRNGNINHSEAFENGGLCDATQTGGPLGIWAWNSDNITIEYNRSHHNHSGNAQDGGGFDLDGGITNSSIRYNFSNENDGYGYQLADFGANWFGAPQFSGNEFHDNISFHDGNAQAMGGIYVWGPIFRSKVFDNIVVTREPGPGKASAMEFVDWSGDDVEIRNNLFYVAAGVPAVQMRGAQGTHLTLDKNHYWVAGRAQVCHDDKCSDFQPWCSEGGFESGGMIHSAADFRAQDFDLTTSTDLSANDFARVRSAVDSHRNEPGEPIHANDPLHDLRSARRQVPALTETF